LTQSAFESVVHLLSEPLPPILPASSFPAFSLPQAALQGSKPDVTGFIKPKEALGAVSPEHASALVAAGADITLVLDADGLVCDAVFQGPELAADLGARDKWVGKRWADLVTVESRTKIAALLRDADSEAGMRWRQVNHPTAGVDVPVLYRTMRTGKSGRIVAFGRDLRSVSALQQRLMDAQQSMERDYSRLRSAETRYRLLFQQAVDGVAVVDGTSQRIVEANPAAEQIFAGSVKRLVGRNFTEIFDAANGKLLAETIAGVRASGRSDEIQLHLDKRPLKVGIAVFRQEGATLLLVRISAVAQAADASGRVAASEDAALARLIDQSPDAFVACDNAGRVLSANAAFLELAQLSSLDQALAGTLDQWIGRDGIDFNVLMANLRQRASVRLFSTSLRGELGARTDVEISAAAATAGGKPVYSFAIRNIAGRVRLESKRTRELPHSVEQLTELVGRVSLKELVRETTDMIERLCIEAALELTRDNRASAAEMLGLSRQSLYVKLRRYGMTDGAAEDAAEAEHPQ
jgi:transcriptional regulator PpsR